ncbi:hypothetical protein ACFL3V_04510 [Nanoarchaeota archaeon]
MDRKEKLDLFATLMITAGQVELGLQFAESKEGQFQLSEDLKRTYKKKFLSQAKQCHDVAETLKSALYRNDRELFEDVEKHITHAIDVSKKAIRYYRKL